MRIASMLQQDVTFTMRSNTIINADSFNVTAAVYFSNEDNAIINADNFNVTGD